MTIDCKVCGRKVAINPASLLIEKHAQGESPDLCPASGNKFNEQDIPVEEVQTSTQYSRMGFPFQDRHGIDR